MDVNWAVDLAKPLLARHEGFMERALQLARSNPRKPFGAIIVNRSSGEVLGEGSNETADDPTHHAEIVAIGAAARSDREVDWADATIYATAEPCPMCAAAIVWTDLSELVYGTSIETLISLGCKQLEIPSATVLGSAAFYSGGIVAGVLAARTDPLYADWEKSLSGA